EVSPARRRHDNATLRYLGEACGESRKIRRHWSLEAVFEERDRCGCASRDILDGSRASPALFPTLFLAPPRGESTGMCSAPGSEESRAIHGPSPRPQAGEGEGEGEGEGVIVPAGS